MKCLGRTNSSLKRCGNQKKYKYWPFCDFHKYQVLFVFVPVLIGFIADIGGAYTTLFPDDDMEKEILSQRESIEALQFTVENSLNKNFEDKLIESYGINRSQLEALLPRISSLVESDLDKGNLFFVDKEYDKAIEFYESALSLDPDNSIIYFNIGAAYGSLGIYERSIAYFQKSIEFDSLYAPAYNYLGNSYLALSEYNLALTNYSKAIEIDSTYWQPYNNIGELLSNEGYPEVALRLYEEVIKLTPNNPAILYNKAVALHELEEDEEALIWFEKAISLNSKESEYYRMRANSYANIGCFEESINDLKKSLELNYSIVTILNFGGVYYQMGDYELAVQYFQDALVLEPNNIVIYVNKGAALNALLRYEEALANYEKALKLVNHVMRRDQYNDNTDVLYFNIGITLNHLERYEEAIVAFDKSIALEFPGMYMCLVNKGNALINLNRIEEGLEMYRKAKSLDPTRELAIRKLESYSGN